MNTPDTAACRCSKFFQLARRHAIAVVPWLVLVGTSRADEIIATLNDGRRVQGALGAKTNAERLFLRNFADGLTTVGSYAWSDVNAVVRDGEPISFDEVRGLAGAFSSGDGESVMSVTPTPLPDYPVVVLPRPASLKVTAWIDSWDADAEPDGIVVRLLVLDPFGQPTAARGDLTIVARGFVRDVYERNDLRLTPAAREIARGYRNVFVHEFHDGTLLARFDVDPSVLTNLAIEPTTVLHARLGVPSVGVLEARCGLELRPWDPLIDRLPYFEGATLPPALWTSPGSARRQPFEPIRRAAGR